MVTKFSWSRWIVSCFSNRRVKTSPRVRRRPARDNTAAVVEVLEPRVMLTFSAVVELSALTGPNGFQINGAAAGDNSGRSVSGAGDINGDGIADLIIGADGADPNGSYSGASHAVFGHWISAAAVNAAPVLANIETTPWVDHAIRERVFGNPPELANTETTPLPYAPGAVAKAITSTLTVTDGGNGAVMTGAGVQILDGYQSGDVLAFTDTGTIRGFWNGVGALQLSGNDTLANWEAALRSVTYASSTSSPAARTVSFQAIGGALPGNTVSRTVGGYAQLVGSTVNVYGTPLADAITVTEGVKLTVIVNGVVTQFTPGAVTAVSISAFAGDDSVNVLSLLSGTTLSADGGDNNDTLTVAAGVTQGATLLGGNGNDTLRGGGGTDILNGGANDDTYAFNTSKALGSDSITDSAGTDRLYFGGSTNDVAVSLGLTSAQTVNANLTLTLNSATSIENLYGGSGHDTLTGNSLANAVLGDSGNDTLSGGAGSGAGTDTLYGQANNDTYAFNTNTALGSDLVTDSAGTDRLDFGGSVANVTATLWTNLAQVVNANLTLRLATANSIEDLYGGLGNDTLSGNTLNNALVGGAGNDVLFGQAGNDSLAGGAGNDTLYGQAGNDSLDGGTENDTFAFNTNTPLGSDTVTDSAGTDQLYFAGSTNDATVSLASAGIQTVNGNLMLTLGASAANLENVYGGSGNNILIGNAANNILVGGAGHDVLTGGAGIDNLQGGGGKNILIGGIGADTLTGGATEDLLLGAKYDGEATAASLAALLAEWTSANTFMQRVDHLLGNVGGGANGGVTLTTTTVHEDNVKDTLTGGNGAGNTDWYLRNNAGVIAQRDTVNDTDLDSFFTNIDTIPWS